MSISLNQSIRLTQTHQLALTPQLQQAIKLLQLNQVELLEMVGQEMVTNPVLEEAVDKGLEDIERAERQQVESDERTLREGLDSENRPEVREALGDTDWQPYFEQRGISGSARSGFDSDERPSWDYNLTKPATLIDHLLWQLQLTPLFSEVELEIGEAIIYSIDEDGYLEASVEEIGARLDCGAEVVEGVLLRLQQFDPVGVAARSLEECLLCQMVHLGIDCELKRTIVRDHLSQLKTKNYRKIARHLQIDEDKVLTAVKVILTLDPKPGARLQPDSTQAVVPEVFVYKRDGVFVVVLNEDRLPRLSVNSYYQGIADQRREPNNLTRNYLTEKIRAAQWLIKSIEQRQKTIYKVMVSIVKFQDDFFARGVHYLKPLVLRDVADDIEMHESTVSRVTQGKYVQTPHGVFELKYFFNSSINQGGGDIASASVKQKIVEYINRESPTEPLSDDAIVKLLAKDQEIKIARRTVAKYRNQLGILASSQRKKIL
ncbi:MAG: RNA polymerase sigma-54 factor [Deltaproteobacteria bacterium]|nr:MAG: RNA polymerase sigma-54 factor [Deltaproteobacteria bacterium]